MITFNIKHIVYVNIKYLKYQSFKVIQYHHKKMIYKMIFEQFLFYFLHGELRLISKRVFLCHGKQH